MSNLTKSARVRNQLIDALPSAEYERLLPNLEKTRLVKGEVLYNIGDKIQRAYFLQSGVISLLSVTSEGETIEVGMVGCEGMVGIPSLLRRSTAPLRTVVQIPGKREH